MAKITRIFQILNIDYSNPIESLNRVSEMLAQGISENKDVTSKLWEMHLNAETELVAQMKTVEGVPKDVIHLLNSFIFGYVQKVQLELQANHNLNLLDIGTFDTLNYAVEYAKDDKFTADNFYSIYKNEPDEGIIRNRMDIPEEIGKEFVTPVVEDDGIRHDEMYEVITEEIKDENGKIIDIKNTRVRMTPTGMQVDADGNEIGPCVGTGRTLWELNHLKEVSEERRKELIELGFMTEEQVNQILNDMATGDDF